MRTNLIKQFNDLRQQLDRTAEDASFNGINLLRGDSLKLTFNETGSSSLTIQSKGAKALTQPISASTFRASPQPIATPLSTRVLRKLSDALGTLRSQSSAFGSNLCRFKTVRTSPSR